VKQNDAEKPIWKQNEKCDAILSDFLPFEAKNCLSFEVKKQNN
jgi:hypothetical protein